MTDDELDGLLAQSGARWRASHTSTASVAFDAAVSGAEIIPLQYDDEVPPEPPAPRRRLWPWVLAAAAAVVLSIGIVVVARPPAPFQSATDQRGPYGNWNLVSFTDGLGGESPATGTKTLEVSAQFGDNNLSTISVSAGCGQMTGFVSVHVDDPLSGALTIGEMTGNASGCASAQSGQVAATAVAQAATLTNVLAKGKTAWNYVDTHLVLTRGKDSLKYERSSAPTQRTAALLGTSWKLSNYSNAVGKTRSNVGSAALKIAVNSTFTGSDGCNKLSGTLGVSGTALDASANASGTALFAPGVLTEIGLPSGSSVDAVLFGPGAVDWTIFGGGKLVIERAGVGSLVFVADEGLSARPALIGTAWTLSNYDDARGTGGSDVGDASLVINADETFSGSDGCNSVGGTVTVTGTPANTAGSATGTATFKSAGQTQVGCPSALTYANVLFGHEPPTWTIYGGSKLALVRSGIGTLVFVKPLTNSSSSTTAPTALAGSSWDLDRWCVAQNCTQPSWVSGPPRLEFADGRFLFADDCKQFVGSADIGDKALRLRSDNGNTSRPCGALQIGAVLPTDGTELQWQLSNQMQLTIGSGTRSLVFVQHVSRLTPEQSAAESAAASPQAGQLSAAWVVTGYCSGGGACTTFSVRPGTKATLTISRDGKVSGNYGCPATAFTGTLTEHADSTFAIDFSHDVSSTDAATCAGANSTAATLRWTVLHNPKIEWSVNLPQLRLTVGDAELQYQRYEPVASPVNSPAS